VDLLRLLGEGGLRSLAQPSSNTHGAGQWPKLRLPERRSETLQNSAIVAQAANVAVRILEGLARKLRTYLEHISFDLRIEEEKELGT
jgi:hypothetical protein